MNQLQSIIEQTWDNRELLKHVLVADRGGSSAVRILYQDQKSVLAEMRSRGSGVAIVIDEFGGTAGVVTFAGLMERIVGEVGPGGGTTRITCLADGSALIDGLTLVADINAQFGTHIDEETYNTVGGYVLGRLGRRARVGDRFEVEGRVLRVEALDGLRVARVWLSRERSERQQP